MFHGMRLGRKQAIRQLKAPSLQAHAIASEKAPIQLLRSNVDFRPALDANDKLSNCTSVALANCIRAQVAIGGYQVDIPTQSVIDFYSASCGYDPSKPLTDDGGIEVDVLAYQAAHGFKTVSQTAYVGLWASIAPGNLNMIRLAMARMGSVYLGLNLAEADQVGGGVWDINTPASLGSAEPGSWGGHAAVGFSYTGLSDQDTITIATWGHLQRATWAWLLSRLDECHAIYHQQLNGPSGHNPDGVDHDAWLADVLAFNAS